VTGTVELPAGVEMVMPGDNTKMTIELITPIAMEEQLAVCDPRRRPHRRRRRGHQDLEVARTPWQAESGFVSKRSTTP